MQKAMVKVGVPPERGPSSPFEHKPPAGSDVALLRAQVQALQADLAAQRTHQN